MAEEPKKIKLEDILPKYTLEDMLEPDPYVRAELGVINKNFDELELEIGRTLTEEERHEILSIVEALSPKDEDGDIVSFASFTYAWKVYQENLNSRKKEPQS